MGVLKIRQGGRCICAEFKGAPLLSEILIRAGVSFAHPCGGRGACGKCAAYVVGQVSEPNETEVRAGTRLTCQTLLLGDASVWLPEAVDGRIETAGVEMKAVAPIGNELGCAIDIGTTTLAVKLFDLSSGKLLAVESGMNPQQVVAADVIGRIGAALDGRGLQLQNMIVSALDRILDTACKASSADRVSLKTAVVTGNTAMLYLLTGRNPECLSRAPFTADTLFGTFAELLGMRVYYPDCMSAFVGADITCAVLASGMHQHPETALLCDIGTNGEIALWKDGRLYVTSTAAGPAFEGAGISCGCGSVPGAIDSVWVKDGKVLAHTIDDAPAVGICGSGLIDAIAAFLETEDIDETGAVEKESLPLRDGIALLPKDIRAVQLAKAAIGAGIKTLLEMAQVSEDAVETLYISGGFGSRLNVASAAAIGLIPASMQGKVRILGNGALTGATQLLLDRNQIQTAKKLAEDVKYLNLGGNAAFSSNYMERMLFGPGGKL